MEKTILYQELGSLDLYSQRLKKEKIYNSAGLINEEKFYLVKDIDGNDIKKKEVAYRLYGYKFTGESKGVTVVNSYIRIDASIYETREFIYMHIAEIGTLKHTARWNQIQVLKETVVGTEFEESSKYLMELYEYELNLFVNHELNSIIKIIEDENNQEVLEILNTVPFPEKYPEVTAKQNIINRVNAYFEFVRVNS